MKNTTITNNNKKKKPSSKQQHHQSTLEEESLLLRATITNLMGQLDSAQKRMQQVFSQSNNVVSQLQEREKQMSKRVKHQHRRMKEIMANNNNNNHTTSSKNNNDNDDDEEQDDKNPYLLAKKKLETANRIKLNVGGRIFETTRKVLTKYPGSVFDLLLSGEYPVEMDEETGAIFLDRDPDVFAHILRYLRTGVIPAGFLSEHDLSRALVDGEDEEDAKEVEEYLEFLHQKQQHQIQKSGDESSSGLKYESSNIEQQQDSAMGSRTGTAVHPNSFVGGARAAAVLQQQQQQQEQQNNNHNNNTNNSDNQFVVSTNTQNNNNNLWTEYSLAQRHNLLEMEARYFMLDDLLLKLSKNRMRWFCCAQRGRPTPRCFATMQVVGSNGYVFGGCSASDTFFSDLYRVCLHPSVNSSSGLLSQHQQNDHVNGNYYYDDFEDQNNGEDEDYEEFEEEVEEEEEENTNSSVDDEDEEDLIIKKLVQKTTNTTKKKKRKVVIVVKKNKHNNSNNIGGASSGAKNSSHHNIATASTIDTTSLAYYKGPFDWDRVVTRKGQIPEPRSGHTMNVVPAVTNYHSNSDGRTLNTNNTNNSYEISPHHANDNNQSENFDHQEEDYQQEGGLLVLFGNDRGKMLSNAIVYDIAESAWRNVKQVCGDSSSSSHHQHSPSNNMNQIPASRSGHSFTMISSSSDSQRQQQKRFVLIGGKQIFPETTHYDDIFFAEYDPFNLNLVWTKAMVINNNSTSTATANGVIPASALHSGASSLTPDTVEPRSYHSAVYREEDGLLYVFGGIINNVYSNELCTFDPVTCVWRTVANSPSSPDLASHHQHANFGLSIIPSYIPPAARSGHVAYIIDNGERMLVAGSYSEDTEELTVGLLTFSTMKWTTAKVDPRFGGHRETPSRRAAISGCFLPPLAGGAGSRLPMLVVFGGFELSGRRCFNDLYVLPL